LYYVSSVTLTIKSRIVTVKGPRGELVRNFKHCSLDMTLIEDGDKLQMDMWFATKKQLSALGSVLSHINNMMVGVVQVRFQLACPLLGVPGAAGGAEVLELFRLGRPVRRGGRARPAFGWGLAKLVTAPELAALAAVRSWLRWLAAALAAPKGACGRGDSGGARAAVRELVVREPAAEQLVDLGCAVGCPAPTNLAQQSRSWRARILTMARRCRRGGYLGQADLGQADSCDACGCLSF
jgi:hypothetical protein